MSSAKIVMRKNKNKDGEYPMTIRITKDRRTSYIYLGHNLKLSDWDKAAQKVKKSHANSVRLNNLFAKKLIEANDKLLEMEADKKDTSSGAIRKGIVSKKDGTFLKQANLYLNDLKKSGKFNRYSADKPRVERFKEFLNNSDVPFSEITPTLLKRFQAYLKGTRNITNRTVTNHLVVIRTVFNQAIAANVADRKYYPFGKGKVVIKFPDSLKLGMVESEVKAIEELELEPGSILNHARNVWLFSFYFAGMRVSDVLRLTWSDFQDDRIFYAMGKNEKAGSLKVPEKALKILNQNRRENPVHNLVFPDLETLPDLNSLYAVQQRINQKVKRINEGLQEIAKLIKTDKKLTMHISRHTFGNISGDKIPVQMLQKLYRHSSITTTIGYQANFIHKTADEALDAVLGF